MGPGRYKRIGRRHFFAKLAEFKRSRKSRFVAPLSSSLYRLANINSKLALTGVITRNRSNTD